MRKQFAIAAALLFATLLGTVAEAGQYQHWVLYYSDSTFTTPVGKKFQPNDDGCPSPYDFLHQTGTVTIYRHVRLFDECGDVHGQVSCDINGSYVSCPSRLTSEINWYEDWESLGTSW